MNRLTKVFMTVLLFTTNPLLAKNLADRLVLEVNKTSYSQRQFELYVALRSALQAEEKIALVSEENWAKQLDVFRQDMMVEQEAQRLSSAQADRKMVQSALLIVKTNRKRNILFDKFLKRMDADEDTIRRILASIIRVKTFLSTKERQYANEASRLQEKTEVDKNSEWFVKLEQRMPYRVYEGAREYARIYPDGGKE